MWYNSSVEELTCKRCGEFKDPSEFPKGASKKRYGRHAWCRPCRKKYYFKRNRTRKLRVIHALGGECVHCGNTDFRVLQVDHINGGGSRENANGKNWQVYMKVLRGETEEYQLLCANCNWIKRYVNKEERHTL